MCSRFYYRIIRMDSTFYLYKICKIVRIMDPLQDQPCMKGYSQSMVYGPMLHNIGRMFNLAMGLSKSKRNHCIYSWEREYLHV